MVILVEVGYKWWVIDWCQNQIVVVDFYVVCWIVCVLGKLGWGGFQDFVQYVFWKLDVFVVYFCVGVFLNVQNFWVFLEFQFNFSKDVVGVGFDGCCVFIVQNVIVWNVLVDIWYVYGYVGLVLFLVGGLFMVVGVGCSV